MTVIPRATELHDRVIPLGGVSFCRYSTKTAWSRVSLFLTNTMVVYILKGQKIIHGIHGDVVLGPGDGFIARKGSHFFSEILDATEFQSLLWYCDDPWLMDILAELGPLPPAPRDLGTWPWRASEQLVELLRVSLPYFDGPDMPVQILRMRFREVLWHIAKTEQGAKGLSAIKTYGMLQPSVLDVLESHFTKPLHIKDLARLAGRSVASFVRDVRALTNTSPMQWVIQRRLQEARALLQTTARPITEIALDLGFSSPGHLSSSFHQTFGCSPRDLRSSRANSDSIL